MAEIINFIIINVRALKAKKLAKIITGSVAKLLSFQKVQKRHP